VVAARLHLPLALLLCAGALCAHAARADDALKLSWSAPAGCPPRDAVIGEVRRLLGGAIDNPKGVSARAEIRARGASDYQLYIALRSDQGERTRDMQAPTCAELADAAALIIALSIDPSAGAATPEAPPAQAPSAQAPSAQAPLPSPSPSEAPPASTTPAPPPAASAIAPPSPPLLPPPWPPSTATPLPSAAAPRPAPREIHAHAEVACEQGSFHDPSLMGRAGAAFVRGPLRLELTGFFAWAGQIAAPQSPSKGGWFWLGGGALSGCYERPFDAGPRKSSGAVCAGVETGAMGATAYGVLSPSSNRSPWVAPFVAGLTRWAFHPRLALRLDLAASVPLIRADFTIDGVGLVHRPGPLGVRAGLGVEGLLGSF
jgi:hypothetical protein